MADRKNSIRLFLPAFALILALALSQAAFAHEGGKHILGQVRAVDPESLTIVTTAKETVTVRLLNTTKYMKGKQPSSVQELKVGDRVVVHAKQNGKSLEAEEVHFNSSPAQAKK
jgi:Cu/Ag efflux protein CusF